MFAVHGGVIGGATDDEVDVRDVGERPLGPETNLGAGTITANLRHDGNPIAAGAEGYSIGRRKLGAVLGSGTKTGVTTSLQPGTALPTDSWTAPGEVVHPDR